MFLSPVNMKGWFLGYRVCLPVSLRVWMCPSLTPEWVGRILPVLHIQQFPHYMSMSGEYEQSSSKNSYPSNTPRKQNGNFLQNALNDISLNFSTSWRAPPYAKLHRQCLQETNGRRTRGPNGNATRTGPSLYIQKPKCLSNNSRFRLQGQSVGRTNCCWSPPAQSILGSDPTNFRSFRDFLRVLQWGLLFDARKRLTTTGHSPSTGGETGSIGRSDFTSSGLPRKNRLSFQHIQDQSYMRKYLQYVHNSSLG
jgi:hypothetical protein